jgi:hypothetical protein
MKKLLPVVIIATLGGPLLLVILRWLEVGFSPIEAFRAICMAIGWSMTIVGVLAIASSAFLASDKTKFYQGGVCALLGVAIATYSLPALIAAIALVAWMDYRGRPLE